MGSALSIAAQARAARIVGWVYLVTMASAISASAIRLGLIDYQNPTETLEALRRSTALFRLGIVLDLATFAAVVALPVAYYVLLAPVHKGLALLGLSWRLAEVAVMFSLPSMSFAALQFIEGDAHLASMPEGTALGVTMMLLRSYDYGFEAAMILLGLGSIVFNALLYKARYVPRLLAGYGVLSSIYLVGMTFAILLLPTQADTLRLIVFIPGTLGEISLGLWLAIKGVNLAQLHKQNLNNHKGTLQNAF